MSITRRKTGLNSRFTLVELLVVIAIISILAAMLLPTLERAHDMAKSASCINNEKQMAFAVQNYISDNDGWLPISNYGNQPTQWKCEIAPYLAMELPSGYNATNSELIGQGVFLCPMWSHPELSLVNAGGYGWNCYNCGMRWDTTVASLLRKQAQAITRPAETILFGDTVDKYKYGSYEMYYVAGPSMAAYFAYTAADRHNQGMNCAWADGHVEWMPQISLTMGINGNQDWYYLANK